ncbi:MAG: hypothetical protein R3330_14645 [Saprospiraceae bacterium]|nr:hypothetical protein [Saprospiraceae bacterium]
MLGLAVAMTLPASATVHEITGMSCSDGHAVFNPPGLTGGSNAENFARPLIATGVVEIGEMGPEFTDHPASKVEAGSTPELLVWDEDHPSANCNNWEAPEEEPPE